jgi:hypothetical protein
MFFLVISFVKKKQLDCEMKYFNFQIKEWNKFYWYLLYFSLARFSYTTFFGNCTCFRLCVRRGRDMRGFLIRLTRLKVFLFLSFFIFIVAPWILKIHLLSHTNKCTNYIIYYLKSVLIIDIKTLSYTHSSYVFRHITCHPQGALMFVAKITGKTVFKTW